MTRRHVVGTRPRDFVVRPHASGLERVHAPSLGGATGKHQADETHQGAKNSTSVSGPATASSKVPLVRSSTSLASAAVARVRAAIAENRIVESRESGEVVVVVGDREQVQAALPKRDMRTQSVRIIGATRCVSKSCSRGSSIRGPRKLDIHVDYVPFLLLETMAFPAQHSPAFSSSEARGSRTTSDQWLSERPRTSDVAKTFSLVRFPCVRFGTKSGAYGSAWRTAK